MKTSARLWIVLASLVVAMGVVYALTTSTPPGQSIGGMATGTGASTASSTASTTASSGTPVAAAGPSEPVSLSPDLMHTDAYEFLDPVPVGRKAPDFTATTAEGKAIKLSDYRNQKNVVLIFYQGSFCSVCGAQLTNLQNHFSDFKAQDAEIIAISADDKVHAMQSVGEHGLTFPVIPDEGKKLIHDFGIPNVSKKGIAWPSAFVIDKKGVVQMSFANSEGHRLHSNEILPVLSKLTGRPAPVLDYDN